MISNKKSKKNVFDSKNLFKRFNSQFLVLIFLVIIIFIFFYMSRVNSTINISELRFQKMLINEDIDYIIFISNQNIVEVNIKKESILKYKNELNKQKVLDVNRGPHYSFRTPSPQVFNENFNNIESNMSIEKRIGYISEDRSEFGGFIFSWGFFLLFLFGFWLLLRRISGGVGPSSQIFNIGKSKASLFNSDKIRITFDDVAGLQEAKEEIKEIVDFLKYPKKFTHLGGKIPKGALLIGPPGTGKTLLAKAVAGEAHIPFFSLSGSDFMEMFIGVGAARVRDLFKKAKEKAPCIIFIDEIDAVGRSRGKSQMQSVNDEREGTLNSLLVEMDGFKTDSGIVILAATNRPDILDKALLRPGRFDRRISIDKPNVSERKEIFIVHMRSLRMSEDVDPKKLALQTPGFSGAEIGNICNEAALIAARRDKKLINMLDFQYAIDRVIGGLEKKTKVITLEEKRIIAYHEAGHAVVGWFLLFSNPLVKVSIIPRGVSALGYAQYLPKEQSIHQAEQLIDDICMSLGGRIAESIIFKKISTGALSDLERVTQMSYNMISNYGMSEKVGNISFYNLNNSYSSKFYSEDTAKTIDNEVRDLISLCHYRTEKLLFNKIKELKIIAEELLKKEVLFKSDLEKLIGKRPIF